MPSVRPPVTTGQKPDDLGWQGDDSVSLYQLWVLDGEEKTDSHTVCFSSEKITHCSTGIFLQEVKTVSYYINSYLDSYCRWVYLQPGVKSSQVSITIFDSLNGLNRIMSSSILFSLTTIYPFLIGFEASLMMFFFTSFFRW